MVIPPIIDGLKGWAGGSRAALFGVVAALLKISVFQSLSIFLNPLEKTVSILGSKRGKIGAK